MAKCAGYDHNVNYAQVLAVLFGALDFEAAGQEPCAWDERYDDLGGCWIHKGKPPVPGSQCYNTSYCVYSRLFGLINQASHRDRPKHRTQGLNCHQSMKKCN